MTTQAAPDLQRLMTHYHLGDVPHGTAGSERFRRRLSTDVLELSAPEVLRDDLDRTELNDLLAYIGWNQWDLIAFRSSEGESGLIPRQQYETLAWCEMWQRYPEYIALITDAAGGAQGVIDLGAVGRREIGTKINALHIAAGAYQCCNGLGVLRELGLHPDEQHTAASVTTIAQFMRRLSYGYLGEGALFSSQRGYQVRALEAGIVEQLRVAADERPDPAWLAATKKLNASAEMLSYMVHFDNRSGCGDSGPYPLGDGRWMVVRDVVLREKHYFWSVPADKLPYAITIAMVFTPPADGLTLLVNDISTIFTEPRNYLEHLTGVSVYARDEWNTPVERLRRLTDDEVSRTAEGAGVATTAIYRTVARMSRREKILCGAKVYIADFIAPFARAAGVWDQMVKDRDLFELTPTTMEAYYRLSRPGVAERVLGEIFLLGKAFQPLPG